MDRLSLQSALESICEHVYYQPPSNIRLSYPCIVYEPSGYTPTRANNTIYNIRKRYDITFITYSPDPDEFMQIVKLLGNPNLNKPYIVDNLYHYKFSYSASKL